MICQRNNPGRARSANGAGEALHRADEALHRSLRIDDVLPSFCAVAAEILGADKTSVVVWDARRERLVVRAMHGFDSDLWRLSLAPGEGLAGHVAERGQPVVVEDALADPRLLRHVVERERIRSLMVVPIGVGGQLLGVLAVNYCRPHRFDADEQRLVLALAQRAAPAIENARLFDQAEERSRELETLLGVAGNVAGRLTLGPLLEAVLDELRRVVDYSAAAVITRRGDNMAITGYRGPALPVEQLAIRYPLEPPGFLRDAALAGRPVVLDDVRSDSPTAAALREVLRATGSEAGSHMRAWLGVPLMLGDRLLGILSVWAAEPGYFTERHARLALAVANQAAIAIENARLYEAAHDRATLQERQRLARELHDAVTQALFSASLIAEALPRLWARDPEAGLAQLDELRELTRGALAELRALLLELRPTALTEAGLGDLIRQLAEAFTGRARVPVALAIEGQAGLPPDVQVAFYRIAQEALNNVAKHAAASRVELSLRLSDRRTALRVSDDGPGFDAASVPSGHLGVGIMHERAAAVGAELAVASWPGQGTSIDLVWTAGDQERA